MAPRVVKNPQEARQAEKSGVARYVLAISLLLVVILFVAAYVISV